MKRDKTYKIKIKKINREELITANTLFFYNFD